MIYFHHTLDQNSMVISHRVLCNVIFTQKTMALQMCQLGVGAKFSCLSRFIHASQHIRDKYPNPVSAHCLEGCITIHQEVKNVSRRDQLCIVVQHESFKMNEDEYIKLYAIKRYWKVTEEGESDYSFNGMAGEGKSQEEIQVPLPEEVVQAAEDVNHQIEALRNVVDIDDDNKPAPENIPQPVTCFYQWFRLCSCGTKPQHSKNHHSVMTSSWKPQCHHDIIMRTPGIMGKPRFS